MHKDMSQDEWNYDGILHESDRNSYEDSRTNSSINESGTPRTGDRFCFEKEQRVNFKNSRPSRKPVEDNREEDLQDYRKYQAEQYIRQSWNGQSNHSSNVSEAAQRRHVLHIDMANQMYLKASNAGGNMNGNTYSEANVNARSDMSGNTYGGEINQTNENMIWNANQNTDSNIRPLQQRGSGEEGSFNISYQTSYTCPPRDLPNSDMNYEMESIEYPDLEYKIYPENNNMVTNVGVSPVMVWPDDMKNVIQDTNIYDPMKEMRIRHTTDKNMSMQQETPFGYTEGMNYNSFMHRNFGLNTANINSRFIQPTTFTKAPTGNPGSQPETPETLPERPMTFPEQPGSQPGGSVTQPHRPETQPHRSETQPQRPETLSERPEVQPQQSATHPGRPEVLPERPETQPQRPETQPQRPVTQPQRPETQPQRPETQPQRPETLPERPGTQPQRPGTQPQRPETLPERPEVLPERPGTQPQRPETLPERPEVLPERPEVLPGRPEVLPERPEVLPERPEVLPGRPETLPERPEVLPERPEVLPERPEILPERPEILPERPEILPERPETLPEPPVYLPEPPVTLPEIDFELPTPELTPNNGRPMVRILNGNSNFNSINVTIDEDVYFTDLSYTSVTNYKPVAIGFLSVVVTGNPTGNIIFQKRFPFVPGTGSTLAITTSGRGMDIIQVHEVKLDILPEDMGCLRMANIAFGSMPFDLVTFRGQTVFEEVTFKEVTNYRLLKSGVYDFFLKNTYSSEPLASILIDIERGRMYTAYVLGAQRMGDLTQVLVLEDMP